MNRRFIVAAMIAPLLSGIAGCKEPVENRATDNAYLRVPGAEPSPLPMKAGDAMPLKAGASWRMQLRQGDKVAEETEVVSALKPAGDGENITIETRVGNRPVRQEVLRRTSDALQMAAAGFSEKVILNPPLPLYRIPMTIGSALPWNGVLQFRGANAPGTGCSRISGAESVVTPAGKFNAYRVDTVINTTIQGHPASFRVTRWLAPGVGQVRQRTRVGASEVEKTLLAYTIP